MFVNPDNWSDADKYFNNCFIKVKEYGDTLVHIKKVSSEALSGTDEYGQNVCIEIDGKSTNIVGYTLDYILPKKAYFQFGTTACFLSRIPARMWKKGLNPENTKVHVLNKNFGTAPLTFGLLKAFVHKPGYLPYTELEGNESIALSPRVALNSIGNIFVDLTIVGKYYKASKTFTVTKLFEDDIKPLFKGVTFVRL